LLLPKIITRNSPAKRERPDEGSEQRRSLGIENLRSIDTRLHEFESYEKKEKLE
jgi:hypothetical protein